MEGVMKFFYSTILVMYSVLVTTVGAYVETKIVAPEFILGSKRVNAQVVIDLVERIPKLLIIDTRISTDRKQGYIEGSISLPDIKTNCETLRKVIKSKSQAVLFYCNGPKCNRSANSVIKARKCGYKNIYWYRGGFEEWRKLGYPYLKK